MFFVMKEMGADGVVCQPLCVHYIQMSALVIAGVGRIWCGVLHSIQCHAIVLDLVLIELIKCLPTRLRFNLLSLLGTRRCSKQKLWKVSSEFKKFWKGSDVRQTNNYEMRGSILLIGCDFDEVAEQAGWLTWLWWSISLRWLISMKYVRELRWLIWLRWSFLTTYMASADFLNSLKSSCLLWFLTRYVPIIP